MSQRPSLRVERWIPLLAVVAFLPSLLGSFVYDDTLLISQNRYVHDLAHWRHAFSTHFWDVSGGDPNVGMSRYYRPLVTLSYLVNWVLSSGRPWAFHLTNLLLHAGCSWLAYLVGARVTRSVPLGLVGAILFAIHPTRSEAVTWISGRPDPLMALFLLLTVQLVWLGRHPQRRWLAAVGAVASFSAALLCKEPAVAGPLLLLPDAYDAPRRDRAWHWWLIGITSTLSGTYLVLRHLLLPVGPPPLTWTPAHALVTVTGYFERGLYPWPPTFFYKPLQLAPTGPVHSSLDVAVGILLVIGASALGVYAWRRDRGAFLLLLTALAFLGPLLNVFHTGSQFTTSDRFLYLPLWLFALGLCRLFVRALAPLLHVGAAHVAGVGVLLIYLGLNVSRSFDFMTSEALWTNELSINPDNPVALRALSAHQFGQGEVVQAIESLTLSLQRPSLSYVTLALPDKNVDAYARLVALHAQALPDGASTDLRSLVADAVDRLSARTRTSRSDVLAIDWPLDEPSARWTALRGEEIIARHLAPHFTRLDSSDVSRTLLDALPNERLHLTPNPLLIAIAEAREERFDRAQGRLETMRKHQMLMPEIVTASTVSDAETRIRSARQDFARGRAAAQEDEGRLARTRAFATLGAYFRALLEIQRVDPRHPEMLPFYVQLLVCARLESAALQVATQALGSERAAATVSSMRDQLPAELRDLPSISLPSAAPTSIGH